jgi:PAS domain S-box-containing protein
MSNQRQFYLGILIALLLVIPTLLLSMYAFKQLELTARDKGETQTILLQASRLLSTLKDAEVGQRGFLLTGDVAFLAPYEAAIVSLPSDLLNLSRGLASSPSNALLEEVKPLITAKMLELSTVVALYKGGEPEKALAALRSGRGKVLMDSIRSKEALFIGAQSARLFEMDRQLNNSLKRMFLVIIGAGTAWMLFLLGFIHLLYRQVEGRVSSKVKHQVHLQTVDMLEAQTQAVEKLQVANVALYDNKVLFETVLNAVADCVIWVRADDLHIKYTNLAANKTFGYQAETLVGQTIKVILPDLPVNIASLSIGEHEVLGRQQDGSSLIFQLSLRTIIQSEQQFLVFTLRDFTANKRIESALKASELNLHNGIAVAGLGLGVIDYVRNEISLDKIAATLFDLPVGKPIPRSEVHGRFHPEDEPAVRLKMAEALDPSGRGFMAIEHRVVRGDGSVRWLSARKQVVFADNRAGEFIPSSGALAVRDISGLKSVLLELARAKESAEGANLAKSRFLSNMSHELRTPLNAILGFAQLMAAGNPAPSIKQQRSIDQILQAGWYLLELISEILDLALIESGKLTLSTEPSDLVNILNECQAMMEPQGKSHNVLLVFRAPESPYTVRADHTRLKQVLINLLSNAVKYNRKGGTVLVSCSSKVKGTVRISVADTGEGLSSEKIEHLFQLFNRLGQEKLSEEGTGIGLALSKRLIELMGGSIGVESTVGIGSVFWIEIDIDVPKPKLLEDSAVLSSSNATAIATTSQSASANRSKEAP